MAMVLGDLVKQTTNTTGLGSFALIAAPGTDEFVNFRQPLATGDSTYYSVTGNGMFAIYRGALTVGSPDTLSRDAVLRSWNGSSLGTSDINWGAGTKTVRLVMPAEAMIWLDNLAGQVRGIPGGSQFAPGLASENDRDTGVYGAAADALGIATGGVGRVFWNASGHQVAGADNAYDLGVSGARYRYARLAGGLLLGAGGQAFDAYEFGAFTPALRGVTTPGSNTYAAGGQYGRYIRIGGLVFVIIHLVLSAKDAAMAGYLQIAGLPFAGVAQTGLIMPCSFAGLTLPGGAVSLHGEVASGTAVMTLVTSGSSFNVVDASACSGTATINVTGVYNIV